MPLIQWIMQDLGGVSLYTQASLYASVTLSASTTKIYTISASPSTILSLSGLANWHWTGKANVSLVCSLNAIPAGTIAIAKAQLNTTFSTLFIRRRKDNKPRVEIQDIISQTLKPILSTGNSAIVLKPTLSIGESTVIIKPSTGVEVSDE